MLLEITFLIIGSIMAYILIKFNYNDLLSIMLAFLPVLLNVIYDNSEKIKLFLTKFKLRNRQVSVVIRVKNIYEFKTQNVVGSNDIEQKLIDSMVADGIIIGKENNKIRIERQKLRNGKDNNINVRIPIVIYLQVDEDNLCSYMENTMDPIIYKNLYRWISEVEHIWNYVIDYIKDINDVRLVTTVYEAQITIKDDVFKNVYLAKYAPKYINKLELNKSNTTIQLTNDILKIRSKSQKDFKEEIKLYCGIAKDFFE
ncbi:hypothetical protein THYS13_13940 [Thermoanaerobacter sp. YS13]|uniref:hypothetical protein n=1 Tax=Thermoanaerobacter sp. YS13 TaxID=1511746 RepID=UPI000574E82A|nr:hypothetical protein [Thermoanaerobacter sp. YS13]KHO63273.1 hypothetical protein THYS13_13940 [Thermoanaerobacter sp. YS13]